MDVIGHQAPGKDFDVKTVCFFLQELQVNVSTGVFMKDVNGTDSSLRNIMGITDSDNS